MPYLFKTKNKPSQTIEPEPITVEHDGVSVELYKLGSLTLAERLAWDDFRAKLETEGVDVTKLAQSRWLLVACLAYQEIRQQTIEPGYAPDFSLAEQVAKGDRLDIKDENGGLVPVELINKIWDEFWSKELLGWEQPLNVPEGNGGKKKPTGTKSS